MAARQNIVPDESVIHDFRKEMGNQLAGAFVPKRFRFYEYFLYAFIALQVYSAMAALLGAIDITFRETLVMVGMVCLTVTQIGLLILYKSHNGKLNSTMDFLYACCSRKRYDVVNELDILKDGISNINRILYILTRLLQCVFVLFLSYEQINAKLAGKDWVRLPVAFYVPGYKLSLFHYAGTMLLFAIGTLIQISHFYSVPCIFVSFISQILAQYQILVESISLLDERARVRMNTMEIADFDESRRQCFKESMRHYREIIGCTETMKPCLNGLFTLQSILCSLLIATTAFAVYDALKDGSYLEAMLQTSRIITLCTWTFSCCDYGQQLVSKIDHLRFVMYDVEWYTMPIDLRRDLWFSLLSTAKPVEVKSILNVPASMTTFYEVFTAAFNVFMIFIKVKGD